MILPSIIDANTFKIKYSHIQVLGNGPSLKLLDFHKIKKGLIVGCNWLFLHKDFKLIDSNSILCFSDPSFEKFNPKTWLGKLLNKNCKILIPDNWNSIIKWINEQESLNERVFTYSLGGSYKDYNLNDSKLNLVDFPFVKYTASVMTTICLPLVNNINPNEISINGVDANYFINGKFDPYFFDLQKDHNYIHSEKEAENWSINFNQELAWQLNKIKKNGTAIISSFS